jgi:hypothetical protein
VCCTISSCTASDEFVPQDEFAQIVFDETGIEITAAAISEYMVLNSDAFASINSSTSASGSICNPYFKGCFDSLDLLDFLGNHGSELESLNPEMEQVTPAFYNYYQDNADQSYLDNLTIIDGVPIRLSNGTFTRDTTTMVFNWYVNEQLAHQGFDFPCDKIPDVSPCDGVIEIGLEMQWQEQTWFREWPAYVQLTNYPDCDIIDLCGQCVFYDYDPDCGIASFVVGGTYKWDFNNDNLINMTDLIFLNQHYGLCAKS